MPRAPSPTTAPGNRPASASRSRVSRLPSAVTSSIARTAAGRLRLRSPEPWVAVAQAPATEMCGSEPRLGSAQPAASSRRARLPYLTPAPAVTVAAAVSMSATGGSPAVEMRSPTVSAIRLNECPVPRARACVLPATTAARPATVRGLRTRTARNSTFPAQLACPAGRRRWLSRTAGSGRARRTRPWCPAPPCRTACRRRRSGRCSCCRTPTRTSRTPWPG